MFNPTIEAIFFICIAITHSRSLQQDVSNAFDGVNLTAHPSNVIEGLTSILEVRCSFRKDANPSISSVLSIFVSYSNVTDRPEFTYVASVNALDGHAHNVSHDVSEISGSVDNNGESFLLFALKDPSSSKAGVYKCEVSGFDEIGKPLTLANSLTVLEARESMSNVLNEIKKQKRYIDGNERFIRKLKVKIDAIKEQLFYSSQIYKGSRYYMVKKLAYYSFSEARAVCKLFGGYVVELDTHVEFLFVQDFIKRFDTFQLIMTGATDEDQEGIWINKYHSNSSQSFDWIPGHPYRDMNRNCQCFDRDNSWLLNECYCYHTGTTMTSIGYICEIPE